MRYLKEKKRQSPIAFSFQYMNQVVRQNELSLAPELIVKAEISTEFDTLGVGVDLSAGIREKNDYTVMVLGGRIGDRVHIIDYRRIRVMGNLEKLDAMKELLNDWSIIQVDQGGLYYPTHSTCDIWSEAVQYQASLEADFKRICLQNESLYNLIWHPVKGFRGDKLARFRGIMGMFEDEIQKIIRSYFMNYWIASLSYLRSLDYDSASYGDLVEIPYFEDNSKFSYQMKFIGKEQINSKIGDFNTIVLSPLIPEKNKLFKEEDAVKFWISDDDKKIPLMLQAKMNFGNFVIEIDDYSNVK